jgi:hypothetical protein
MRFSISQHGNRVSEPACERSSRPNVTMAKKHCPLRLVSVTFLTTEILRQRHSKLLKIYIPSLRNEDLITFQFCRVSFLPAGGQLKPLSHILKRLILWGWLSFWRWINDGLAAVFLHGAILLNSEIGKINVTIGKVRQNFRCKRCRRLRPIAVGVKNH